MLSGLGGCDGEENVSAQRLDAAEASLRNILIPQYEQSEGVAREKVAPRVKRALELIQAAQVGADLEFEVIAAFFDLQQDGIQGAATVYWLDLDDVELDSLHFNCEDGTRFKVELPSPPPADILGWRNNAFRWMNIKIDVGQDAVSPGVARTDEEGYVYALSLPPCAVDGEATIQMSDRAGVDLHDPAPFIRINDRSSKREERGREP